MLVGCATPRQNQSEVVSDGRKDIVLYYATTRNFLGNQDPDKFFGNFPGTPASKTRVGRYPATTKLDGSDFRPGNLRVMNDIDWLNEIRNKVVVDNRPKRTILIFVHGYNTSFTEAAENLARLESGFGDDIVPLFYTWPSRASVLRYNADENEAGKSGQYFAEFLHSVRSAIPEAEIAIVAHSMGNRVAIAGVDIESRMGETNGIPKRPIKTLALVAADVDREHYSSTYSKSISKSAKYVVIYVSAKDRALAASRKVHGAVDSRLGQTDPTPYSDGLSETIDATDAGTDFLGHGYFASNRVAINDIVLAVRDGNSARFRPSLRPMPGFIGTKYWWLLTN